MKFFRRFKLKSLFLILASLVLIVFIGVTYLKNDPVNYVSYHHDFMELPETEDRRYKIINKVYSPQQDADEQTERFDVGIASQTSINHLHNLVKLVEVWNGPISVGILALGIDLEKAFDSIKNLVLCHQKIAEQVTFSVLVSFSHPPEDMKLHFTITKESKCFTKERQIQNDQMNYDNPQVSYPVNALRNIALHNLLTSHVFVIDIDMIPDPELRNHLVDFILPKHAELLTAFVVPAFEVDSNADQPNNKKELLRDWKTGSVRPFYSDVCWKCQKYTQYEYWQNEEDLDEEMYHVDWQDPWEPFYVARRKLVHYDERFEQYGFNRISQLCDLHSQGVNFFVLKKSYLLHVGFKKPNAFHGRKDEENTRNRMLYRNFKNEKVKTAIAGRSC